MEGDEAEDRALTEIEEETGMDARIIGKGEPIPARDRALVWKIYPFLAEVDDGTEPEIDW